MWWTWWNTWSFWTSWSTWERQHQWQTWSKRRQRRTRTTRTSRKGGVVFTRWGRFACPNTTGTQLLYKGSYSCKDDDKEGQNTQCNCIELEEKGKFNCTNCLLVTVMKDNTWTALIKGQRDSSISWIQFNNVPLFQVKHCL